MDVNDTLRCAFERRSLLFDNMATNCFRLCNGEGDGFDGLTIDRYGDFVLVQFFRRQLFDRRELLLHHIITAVQSLPVSIKGIVFKNRTRMKSVDDIAAHRKSSVIYGEAPPQKYTVIQNNVIIDVDLVQGQSTGLFLDMREVREDLVPYFAKCSSLLNLYSYTAVFSLHALLNGADNAINVDLSKAVLRKAQHNYTKNRLPVDDRDFIFGDAREWVKRFIKKKKQFNFIILDPPTFSRNKKKTFSVKKDYEESLLEIDSLLDNGYVLTSINSYFISENEFFSYHPPGWKLEFFRNESSDFPYKEKPYLKVGLWKIG